MQQILMTQTFGYTRKFDSNGNETNPGAKVDAVEGNNVIYNSIAKSPKDKLTQFIRIEDRISLLFADGTFGNLPKNQFRIYYRKGLGSKFVIIRFNAEHRSLFPIQVEQVHLETITVTAFEIHSRQCKCNRN